MLARAPHTYANAVAYHASRSAEDFAAPKLSSGERICPPRRRGGDSVLALCIVSLVALVTGLTVLDNKEARQRWFSVLADLLAAASAPSSSAGMPADPASMANLQRAAQTSTPERMPASPEPLAAREVADAPIPVDATSATPPAAASSTPAQGTASTAPEAPTAAATAEPSDPYQAKAAAVGLSPDLSRVLLKRLSASDYRNAGIAIETAVAKTPDTGSFVWPRQRKPELALFRVHFVAGAAPDCRRYVVTVTKDGWSTTAPPMEKCLVHAPHHDAKSAAAG